MKRLLVSLLVLIFLAAVGIVTACGLLSSPDVRLTLRLPPDTPNPLAWLMGDVQPEGREIIPLEDMGQVRGPNRFRRQSWEGADRRPTDPHADPLRGTTQVMFFHTTLETRLSSELRQARLPGRVLKLGIAAPPWLPSRRPKGAQHRSTPAGLIGYIEVYAGDPISRPALEETADRAIQITFQTCPQVEEVDIVAVPWRGVPGRRPPEWLSVCATRESYAGVAGARSHLDNLRTCGDIWVDPRAMADFP